MAKKVSYGDLAEGDPLAPIKESGRELIKIYEAIIAVQKDVLAGTRDQAKSNSFGNINDIKAAADSMNQAKVAAEGLAGAEKNLKQATEQLSRDLEKEDALLKQIKGEYAANVAAQIELIKQTEELKNKKKTLTNAIDMLSQAGAKNSKQVRELADEVTQLTIKEKILKQEAAKLNQTINAQTKENIAAEDSMDAISQRLGQMKAAYRSLSAEERDNVEIGGVLLKGISETDTEIKALDASIGNHQRNVGDYSGHLGKMAQQLRNVGSFSGIFAHALGVSKRSLDDARIATEHILQAVGQFQEAQSAAAEGTKKAAFFQKLWGLAVGNTTGALKVMRLALIATGIGAFLVLLGLLVTNFGKIKAVLGLDVNPATKKLAEETHKAAEASKEALEAFDLEERMLRALGTAEIELIGLRRQKTKETLESAVAEMEAQKQVLNATIQNYAKLKGVKAALGPLGGLFGTDEEDVEEQKKKLTELENVVKDFQARILELGNKEGEELAKQQTDIEDLLLANMNEGLAKELEAERLSYERRREALGENYEAISLLVMNHEKNNARIRKEFNDKRLQELAKQEADYRDLLIGNMNEGLDKLLAAEQNAFERRKTALAGNYKALEELEILHQKTKLKIIADVDLAILEAEILSQENSQAQLKKATDSEEKRLEDELLNEIDSQHAKNDQLEKAEKGHLKMMEDLVKENAESIAKATEFADQFAQKQADKRIKRIDEEVNASKKRADDLRQLALNGDKNAQQSIAAEEKRQVELERRREKEAQKAKRRELLLTGINTYNAKVQAGDKNALGSTLRDLTLLAAALNAIPGFIEGTENVARDYGRPHRPGKDGYVARFDGDERILSPEQNGMIDPSLSNDQLATIANMYQKGMLLPASRSGAMYAMQGPDMSEVVEKLDQVNKNLQNMPDHSLVYDEILGIITHMERRGQNVKVTKWRA